MAEEANGGDTSDLTPADAASLFEALSPGDEADTDDSSATPPSSQTESDDAEAAPEQADAEDESPDDEQQDEADADQPADELYTVTVDGKSVQVTKDELLKGYSRQTDYTRKTQELAEQRKAVEAENTAVRDERKRHADSLKQLEDVIKAQTPTEPDWHTLRATTEPAEYAALYAEWDQHNKAMDKLAKQRADADAAVRADEEKQFRTHLQEQTRLFAEAVPDMKDPEKAKTVRANLVAAAEAVGFTKSDLNNVTDHRLMLLLDKAAKYDKAQKARPVLQQKIDKLKTATPGAAGSTAKKPVSAQVAAAKRLAQTGSIRDAAASGVFG